MSHIDLYLTFEIPSWRNLVRQTWLFCLVRTWFLQALKFKMEQDKKSSLWKSIFQNRNFKIQVQGVLALCEFHYCEFHYCGFSKLLPKFGFCYFMDTGSSCLMRISLLRISLLRFFKTITKIWLMRFYGLFILLLRT